MKKHLFLVAAGLLFCTSHARAEEVVVPRFDLRQIHLEGNTLLPADEVAAILKKYTGPQKDFGTIQEAIDELDGAYRTHGYTMVTLLLPEQELEHGTVTINVLEPKIKEIVVDGNQHFSRENVLRALPTLKSGVPPKVTAISENLRAANENPARKLTLQFKSDEKDTDLTALVKVVDQKPWRVSLSGDNTGSSATGRYRASLGFQHSNLFDLDHVLALQYITSPDHFDKVQIFSGSYRLPLYKLGDTLDLFGAYSDVDSGTTQVSGTNIAVSGKGIISGVRYNMTLPRAGEYEQKLIGGLDYRLYDNTTSVSGTNVARDVVAHPLSLSYGGVWTTEAVTLDGSAGLLYNIPWGGLGQKSDFEAARGGATANYLIARYGLSALARPGADWMLHFSATGQYSNDRLIPGEQFGLGGSTSIRGYEEREESWDGGFSGTAEIYSPDLARLMDYSKAQLRLVGFYDGGYGYNQSPTAGEFSNNSLHGIGSGVRLTVGDYLNLSLDWGHALNDSTTTTSGTNRIHFKASLSF